MPCDKSHITGQFTHDFQDFLLCSPIISLLFHVIVRIWILHMRKYISFCHSESGLFPSTWRTLVNDTIPFFIMDNTWLYVSTTHPLSLLMGTYADFITCSLWVVLHNHCCVDILLYALQDTFWFPVTLAGDAGINNWGQRKHFWEIVIEPNGNKF
jgi:hypothetical protein